MILMVDLDGVACNTPRILAKRFVVPPDYDQYDFSPFGATSEFFCSSEGLDLFRDALPMPGAQETLAAIARMPGITPAYWTHRPQEAYLATAAWLMDHRFPDWQVLFGRKEQHAQRYRKEALAAIEDRPEEVETLREMGLHVFVMHHPYNRHTWRDPGAGGTRWRNGFGRYRGTAALKNRNESEAFDQLTMQELYNSALAAVQEAEERGQDAAYLMLKVPGHGLWERAQVLPGVYGEFVSEEFSGGRPVTVVRVDARAVLRQAEYAGQPQP